MVGIVHFGELELRARMTASSSVEVQELRIGKLAVLSIAARPLVGITIAFRTLAGIREELAGLFGAFGPRDGVRFGRGSYEE
jgi:hypothetical protein